MVESAEREGLKKRYLGRADPETGEIISTAGKRGRPKKTDSTQNTPPDGNGKDYQVLYKNFSAALRKTENGRAYTGFNVWEKVTLWMFRFYYGQGVTCNEKRN